MTNLKILKKLRCCLDRRVKHENWILSNAVDKGRIIDLVSSVSPSPFALTKHLLRPIRWRRHLEAISTNQGRFVSGSSPTNDFYFITENSTWTTQCSAKQLFSLQFGAVEWGKIWFQARSTVACDWNSFCACPEKLN